MKKNCQAVQYMWRMSVRPTYSVAFLVRADGLPPSRSQNPPIQSNKPMGIVSKKAATRMANAVNWLMLFSHKKRVYSKSEKKSYWFTLNFITLSDRDWET